MRETIGIRPETAADAAAIHAVQARVFGREAEARLVAALRAAATFSPALSLVAEEGGRIVGHVLFTPIVIRGDGAETPAVALAPVGVLPERQRDGIGAAMIRRGLEACVAAGHRIAIVLGHAAYYPRFGFVCAASRGIRAPFPVSEASFMVLELVPGALAGVRGTVAYPPAFSEV